MLSCLYLFPRFIFSFAVIFQLDLKYARSPLTEKSVQIFLSELAVIFSAREARSERYSYMINLRMKISPQQVKWRSTMIFHAYAHTTWIILARKINTHKHIYFIRRQMMWRKILVVGKKAPLDRQTTTACRAALVKWKLAFKISLLHHH